MLGLFLYIVFFIGVRVRGYFSGRLMLMVLYLSEVFGFFFCLLVLMSSFFILLIICFVVLVFICLFW